VKKYIVKKIRNFFRTLKKPFMNYDNYWEKNIPEIDEVNKSLIQSVGDYTMTPLIRRWNLVKAIHYINKKKLEGDIVESGIWRGGNLFLSKKIQDKYYPYIKRNFYGFDTFEGMTEPTANDDLRMINIYKSLKKKNKEWVKASIDDVINSTKNIFSSTENFYFIKGRVENTLNQKNNLPNQIALLRLDTDWYESTKKELEILYPLLVKNGILIIDDYGDMIGCRKAVDEYFNGQNVLIISIDRSCRIIVKN